MRRCRNKSNQSFDTKKATESAYHEYCSYLEEYNKMIDDAQILYKDSLNRLQDLDEERVKVVKV